MEEPKTYFEAGLPTTRREQEKREEGEMKCQRL